MIWKAGLVLCLALCVVSNKRPAISEQNIELFTGHHGQLSHIGQHKPEHHDVYAWAYPSYEFSYHVDDPHTHDNKGQHEIRDGDKVTGNYWLIQPDGLKRTVKYSSDHKNGFHAQVHYQSLDGDHYDVREDHGHKDHSHWDPRRQHIEENKGHRWNEAHDGKRRVGIDERRDGDYKERRDDTKQDKQHQDNRWHHDDRRRHDDKRDHDDKHDHGDILKAWIKARADHKDDGLHGARHDIDDRRDRHGHEEHWRHGVLVGWREGSGYLHKDRNDHHRDRHDSSNMRDGHDRGDDKRSEYRYEDHHGQYPKRNFKPFIPYGQRLD